MSSRRAGAGEASTLRRPRSARDAPLSRRPRRRCPTTASWRRRWPTVRPRPTRPAFDDVAGKRCHRDPMQTHDMEPVTRSPGVCDLRRWSARPGDPDERY